MAPGVMRCSAKAWNSSATSVNWQASVPGRRWRHFRKYFETFQNLVRVSLKDPPALAILLDFPEFNLRLAKKLKRAGIKVVYYISPQLWAWRSGRVRIVRRYVDKMLVILPFEEEFYRSRGVDVEFVGHPLLEDFSPNLNRVAFCAGSISIPSARPLHCSRGAGARKWSTCFLRC